MTAFTAAHKLQTINTSVSRRSIIVKGIIKDLSPAFGVDIAEYKNSEHQPDNEEASYFGRQGPIMVPEEVAQIIEGVFGLDQRPIGMPATAVSADQSTDVPTPPQIARAYDFPNHDAAGQTLGLLEFGGGYYPADIHAYFQQLTSRHRR